MSLSLFFIYYQLPQTHQCKSIRDVTLALTTKHLDILCAGVNLRGVDAAVIVRRDIKKKKHNNTETRERFHFNGVLYCDLVHAASGSPLGVAL